jgi:alcohol dehydrogenase class IV
VLVCTSGTAGANYFPAVIEAQESCVPLLVITADRPPEMRDCRSGQTIDQRNLYGGHVNFHHELAVPEATLAGLEFSNVGVALVHAMEYPVGGAVHCSHGAGNGLLLPYVMRFNLPGREQEFASIAKLLGEREEPEAAIRAVEKLRSAIGIPKRIRDLGVTENQLRPFAEKAAGIRRILRVNPRVVSEEEVEGIYRAAW